jgi:3-hydroxyacyl-[acyl-carrier-protein] dehydratase
MKFDLVDRVLESSPTRIVTIKLVSNAEEYLQDHFPTFPVLPGVMMLEALVQAARRLATDHLGRGERLVLGQVRALKYGSFVPPGSMLRVEVHLHQRNEDGTLDFKAHAFRVDPGTDPAQAPVAASGRFMLRPVRLALPAALARV